MVIGLSKNIANRTSVLVWGSVFLDLSQCNAPMLWYIYVFFWSNVLLAEGIMSIKAVGNDRS